MIKFKSRSRKLAFLLVISMIATMFMGLGAASAAKATLGGADITYTTLNIVDDQTTALRYVTVVVPSGQAEVGDRMVISLNTDYTFDGGITTDAGGIALDSAPGGGINAIMVPYTVSGDDNKYDAAAIQVTENSSRQLTIEVIDTPQEPSEDFTFYIYLGAITVDSGASDCQMTFRNQSSSGFFSGSIVLAIVDEDEAITITIDDTETSNDDFSIDLTIEESVAGSLQNKTESIRISLPNGFEWHTTGHTVNSILGDTIGQNDLVLTTSSNDRELRIQYQANNLTTSATTVELLNLSFSVADDTKIKAGDIIATISGKSTISGDTSVIVGTYGEYTAKLTIESVKEVLAGMFQQEIGTLVVEEAIAGSLNDGRNIILTLPEGAKWTSVPAMANNSGVTLEFIGMQGSEGDAIRYRVTGSSSNKAAKIELKDMEIAVDAIAAQDLKVEVSGSAGLDKEEIVIAKIIPTVALAASTTPDVKIGLGAQAVGDITITELGTRYIQDEFGEVDIAGGGTAAAGSGTPRITLKSPAGTEFAKIPTVTLESGDLSIDVNNVTRAKPGSTDYYQYIHIPVDGQSTSSPGVIKVSDIQLTVDRTVPEGNLNIALVGGAVMQTGNQSSGALNGAEIAPSGDDNYTYDINEGFFPQRSAVTSVTVAKVTTPAPSETVGGGIAVFTIGSTSYTIGETVNTMDVAPYIKDSRTYMPIRYVAYALGISDNGIIWDESSRAVTLSKDSKVVQLQIGSNELKMNGAIITMDVAPEIVNSRTMLPASWVAQAFGASVDWDASAQTVTITV